MEAEGRRGAPRPCVRLLLLHMRLLLISFDRLPACRIAALDPKDKTDIDYNKVTEPRIVPQGAKNLRDQFRVLMERGETEIREMNELDEEVEIAFAGASGLPASGLAWLTVFVFTRLQARCHAFWRSTQRRHRYPASESAVLRKAARKNGH